MKLNVLLDLRAELPAFASLHEGNRHEVAALDEIPVLSGAYYVLDRGYLDFARLHRLHAAGAFFVTRLKTNTRYYVVASRPVAETIFTYLQQNSVMLYAGSWDYAVLRRDGIFTTGILPMPMPAPDDPVYGALTLGPVSEAAGNPEAMLGVLRSSRHPEVALDFLHYLSSQPVAAEFCRISHRVSSVIGTPLPPAGDRLAPRLEGELPGFTPDFRWFAAGSSSNFFQRHLHGALGPRGDVAAFAAQLNAEMPRHLRQDLAWHLQQIRRDVQRLDGLVAFHLTLPDDDPRRSAWTRHAETQHVRQLENLHYRPLTEP